MSQKNVRVYYVEEDPIELQVGYDEKLNKPKTVRLAKRVEAGGATYVWAPPGCNIAKEKVEIESQTLVNRRTGAPFKETKRLWVVKGGVGKKYSYQDMPPQHWLACKYSANQAGLLTEQEFYEQCSDNEKVERLQGLIAEHQRELDRIEKLKAKESKPKASASKSGT